VNKILASESLDRIIEVEADSPGFVA